MGIVCGLGNNLQDVWSGITEGKSGISTIESMDASQLAVQFGGEVKNFTPDEEALTEKEAPRFDRFIGFGVQASYEALKHSGLLEDNPYDPTMMGTIVGVGMGGFPEMEKSTQTFYNRGPRRISPFFIPAVIPNMVPGLVSIKYGLKGINYSVSSACASAAHAISNAVMEIRSGQQDVIVSGGAESCINNLSMQGFISMKALSRFDGDPKEASRPFDTGRNGFIMGEGSGMLVLENYEKAKARGATIYAEVVGYGASSDAHHITAPHPDGEGACRSMEMAIRSAGVNPDQIGYVNAHGTSTPLGDLGETKALKKTFGDHAHNLLVSSTKSMTGHLLGAAGGIETIFCSMALHSGIIPPTINLTNPDPECDLNYVPNQAVNQQVEYALNNSFGFGGTNSSLILKRGE
jgi:3-oxoacyl-[acyl-carrier-protein] synthase II